MNDYDYQKMLYLATEYYDRTGDEVFNKFFDMENKKHIKEKTEVLQWALDNNANIIDYKDVEIQIILDDYPQNDMWDL